LTTTSFGHRNSDCENSCATIEFVITNGGDKTYLLYNLRGNIQLSDEEVVNCDSIWGSAVTRLNLYDTASSFIPVVRGLEFGGDRDFERFDKWNKWFTEGKLVLRPGEAKRFVEVIDLYDYRLPYGTSYNIELVYVQHDRSEIELQVQKEVIDHDLADNEAELFRGCIFSNKVALTVIANRDM